MTILESAQAFICKRGIERSLDTDSKSLDNKCAATNSSLGMVTNFSGATLNFEVTRVTVMVLSSCIDRR